MSKSKFIVPDKKDNKDKEALERFRQPCFGVKQEEYIVQKEDGEIYLVEEQNEEDNN